MKLQKELLDLLCCPQCKGEVVWQDASLANPEGAFCCAACQLAYPVKQGLPRFLQDEAQTL